MNRVENFENWLLMINEAQEEDEWIIRKLRTIIRKAKKIPKKQRMHILVGFASSLLALSSTKNVDYLIKSLGDVEFSKVYDVLRGAPDEETETVKKPNFEKNKYYTVFDLNTDEGFEAYRLICQKTIDEKSHNLLMITGDMLAQCAKRTFKNTGIYVPAELALAQLTLEYGFKDDPNARAVKTKNPYNVGNEDDGKNRYFNKVEDGIQVYFDLIASAYLNDEITPDYLIQRFVRHDTGHRYASALNYEEVVRSIMKQIRKRTESIIE